MCNVLRKPQKEQFCQNLNVSAGQEAFEAAVVLELSESSFCLDGTVAPKQLSRFGGNVPVRLLAHLLKFPADGNLFSSILIFFYGGHDENSGTLEEFLNLLDSCTEKELKMLLDISQIILAVTRSNSEIGELETG